MGIFGTGLDIASNYLFSIIRSLRGHDDMVIFGTGLDISSN